VIFMSGIDRRAVFLLGACSGAVAVVRWRPLLKHSVILGLEGGARLKVLLGQGFENVVDVVFDAQSVVAAKRVIPELDLPVEPVLNGRGPSRRGSLTSNRA
jgi:hypothetical protein